MSNKTVNWGIIGAGDVTERKSGPAFYKSAGSTLAAVMRRDGDKAADYARRHNVPRWYTDAGELIADPQVDAVYVATPPDTHARYAIQALEAGKPVYVEKPMALNYNECLAMIATSRRMNVPLYVAYYRRAMPYFLKVKSLLDDHKIGTVLSVTLRFMRAPLPGDSDPGKNWRLQKSISGGGYLADMGSHQINLLQYLFGEILAVQSVAANRGDLYEVEDTVSALLQFRSGVTATCMWCFVADELQQQDWIEVSGSRGFLRFSAFDMQSITLKVESFEDITQIPPLEHVQMPMIEQVNRWILENDFNTEWTQDAAATTKILDQILK